jgi:hypothetical protein
LVGGEALAEVYPGARQVRPTEAAAADCDLLVAGSLTQPLLDSLARGHRVLLLANGTAPGEALRFKSPWWFPTAGDSNLGTIVRPAAALGDFPHEGWCDLPWFDLIQGATALVHDGPLASAAPIIQAGDMPLRQQTRSLLFEARVGTGRLLATTLNLTSNVVARDPAARCLLDNLVAYARGDRFAPQAALSEQELAAALAPGLDLASPVLEGFAGLVAASPDPHSGQTPEAPPAETAWWGHPCRTWIVRQDDGARSISWETAPLPQEIRGAGATFVWSGKLGWVSEPAQGFSLALDGTPVLKFEVTTQVTQWADEDGQVRLAFQPRGVSGIDVGGVFRLYVPRDRLTPGRPVRVSVTGGAGSRRWFGLHEDRDALNRTSGLR